MRNIRRLGSLSAPAFDRSIAGRWTSPIQPATILIAITFALFQGLWILQMAYSDTGSSAGDLATSFAFIVLISFSLGIWMGTRVAMWSSELAFQAIDAMRRRVDELHRQTEGFLEGVCETRRSSEVGVVSWVVRIATLAYALAFALTWISLMVLALYKYTYSSDPVVLHYTKEIIGVYILLADIAILLWLVSIYTIGFAIFVQWGAIWRVENIHEASRVVSRLSQLTPRIMAIGDAIVFELERATRIGIGKVKMPQHSSAG